MFWFILYRLSGLCLRHLVTEKVFCVRSCVLRGRGLGLAESVGDKVLDSDGN